MASLDTVFEFTPGTPVPPALQIWRGALQTGLAAEALERLAQAFTAERVAQFQIVMIGSDFAGRTLCEKPHLLLDLLTDGSLDRRLQRQDFLAEIGDVGADTAALDKRLRQVRTRAMLRIIWRDLNRLSDTLQTTAEVTALAEACVQAGLDHHYHALTGEAGAPQDSKGRPQPFLVIGMGKLGAWELNLSSDIDLIFAYPRNGETQGARKTISNQEFFNRLGQRLIRSLDALTQDGFVFRVDMRLRPYGQSGALVSNFDALEDYYQTQGREWERFAMIKARVIASNANGAQQRELMDLLRSFTYRRYVDFSAIDALRNLKQLINREAKRKKLDSNIKLGWGGIREVEFIGQAFQIIRGGRDTELQDRRLLHILPLLCKLGCLPPGTDQELRQAYLFLRDVEHGLQAMQDRQTQSLPNDDLHRARLAHVMGFADWTSFTARLLEHRNAVHRRFGAVIAEPDEAEAGPDSGKPSVWQGLWLRVQLPDGDAQAELQRLGFTDTDRVLRILQEDILQAPAVLAMHAPGRVRLDELMPRLLKRLAAGGQPTETLTRLVQLITAVARRSAYLLLLSENPGALDRLVTLSEASPWIANRLAQFPALLDELLNPATLFSVPPKDELAQDLRQQVLRVDSSDLEGQMEALRYFRAAHALKVAACEITGKMPLMKVSDYLTELAEVILEYVLEQAWQLMVARHGLPCGDASKPSFIIVAYGKLGGIELAHGSDLDLVFIHDADTNGSTTGDAEGNRRLDNSTFYMRLGQKIIHLLTTVTPAGTLYEVDMRLRPSGNSGLLVSRFAAFEKYQYESAWTWEHQALVRARAVAGDALLCERFETLRRAVLTQARDLTTLKNDVLEMRQKMRTQLGSKAQDQAAGKFHLKQDAGGIVDIEFMVQYAVLAWANRYPELTRYPDNIRILERLQVSGQLETQEVNQLIEAYKAFRSIGHRLALQQQPSVVDGETMATERQAVIHIWQKLFGCP